MARTVGLSRNLKFEWLDKVSQLVIEENSEQEIKVLLDSYLSSEIASETNLRKTRELLMNTWVYENENTAQIKSTAIQLLKSENKYKLVVHWCMLLARYPVFGDMCTLIGKFSEFQDSITLAQLKQKLYDDWGERTTLQYSINRIIATLKNFEVIENTKPGKYQIKYFEVESSMAIMLMVLTSMIIQDKGYYSFGELATSPLFFPFEYTISKDMIFQNEHCSFTNFGGELSVVYTKDVPNSLVAFN